MNRRVLGLLAFVAMFVTVVLLTRTREQSRGAAPAVADTLPGAKEERVELRAPALAPGVESSTETVNTSVRALAPSRREVAPSAIADELARAQWVEGRVVFPAGTPADEEVFVVARGRKFSDGAVQRARVERDGRFRVAFSAESENGWLALEAHYLQLESTSSGVLRRNVFWERGQRDVVLEPMLGGRITGRLLVPAGMEPRTARGEVTLVQGRSENVDSHFTTRARQDVDADLAFDFGGVPAGSDCRVVYEGADFVSSAADTEVEAGGTSHVQIDLVRGAVVSGRVVDESGVGVGGIEVDARVDPRSFAVRIRSAKSGPTGEFRISALRAGDVALAVRTGEYQDVEFDVGQFAIGDVREGVEIVLRRGNSIAGRVRWPEGTPAEARIEAFAVAPGSDSAHLAKWTTSSANGTFRITGLDAGPYTIRAKGKRTEEVTVWSEMLGRERTHKKGVWLAASVAHVAVGTADLVLVLSAGYALEGRVVDDLGAPVRKCRLTVHLPRSSPGQIDRYDRVRTVESKDGSFRLDGLSPGEWELTASGEGYDDSEAVRFSIPAESPVVITLPRDARVRQKP